MHYTVYQITNKVNKKIYIGVHQTEDLDDGYYGSGTILNRSIEKHGLESFEKQILHIFDNPEEMFSKEAELVNEDFVKRPDTYNLRVGGQGGWDYVNRVGLNVYPTHSETLKENFALGTKVVQDKLKNDFEFRKAFCKNVTLGLKKHYVDNPAHFLGRNHSQETKQKMSKSQLGKHTGQKNSQYGTCWIHSLELKENKKIPKIDLDKWIDQGYTLGRKIKK